MIGKNTFKRTKYICIYMKDVIIFRLFKEETLVCARDPKLNPILKLNSRECRNNGKEVIKYDFCPTFQAIKVAIIVAMENKIFNLIH